MTDDLPLKKAPEEPENSFDSTDADADISFELEEGEVGEGLLRDKLKELRGKLKACQKEASENLAGWQRVRADFANLKRETNEERGKLIRFAEEGLVEDLLPVLEGYDGATRNKEAWEKVPQEWRVGVEYLFQKLIATLEERGLSRVRPKKAEGGGQGEKFDPTLHVAIELIPVTDESEDDRVLETIRDGYKLHDKILKPAQVKVGNFNNKQ